MKYLEIQDIGAYKIAFSVSNYIWDIVISWKYFERNTVGSQFVRAIDSISANIAEGFGRYNKKEKIHFYRISFGSLKEAIDWTEKSKQRKLLTEDSFNYIMEELSKLHKEINFLIRYTNEKLAF